MPECIYKGEHLIGADIQLRSDSKGEAVGIFPLAFSSGGSVAWMIAVVKDENLKKVRDIAVKGKFCYIEGHIEVAKTWIGRECGFKHVKWEVRAKRIRILTEEVSEYSKRKKEEYKAHQNEEPPGEQKPNLRERMLSDKLE